MKNMENRNHHPLAQDTFDAVSTEFTHQDDTASGVYAHFALRDPVPGLDAAID